MLNSVNFDSSLSVVIPLHNKQNNIEFTIDNLVKYLSANRLEIIIVENGSTDNSKKIALNCVNKYNSKFDIKLVESEVGLGNALKKGFSLSKYEWLYFLPADFSIGLSDIEYVVEHSLLFQYDVFAGSKTHSETVIKRKFNRYVYSFIFNRIIKYLFGLEIMDTQGTVILKKELFDRLDNLDSDGYLFSTELLIRLNRLGYYIKEIPIKELNIINNISTVAPLKVGINMLTGLLKLKKNGNY